MPEIVDGYGQIGTRIWHDLSSAPAPRLGAIICVDGGVGGQFYVGVHDPSGVLSWETLAATGIGIETIISHILAAGTTPTLTVTTLPDGNFKLDFGLSAGANGISVETVTSHVLSPGSTPTLTTTDLPDGNLALDFGLSAGVGIDEVIYHVLAAGSTPTLTVTTQPDGNLALDFGIAAGATGATGPAGPVGIVSLPEIPAAGSSVEFVAIVETTGFMFPWVLPAGSTIRVNGFQGRWRTDDSGSLFYTDGNGTATGTLGGFPIGALLIENQHLGTNQNGTTFQASDIWTHLYILDAPGQAILYANTLDPTLNGGYLICDITVSIPPDVWCMNFDFTLSDGGFAVTPGGAFSGTWTSGVGWHVDDPSQILGIYKVAPLAADYVSILVNRSPDDEVSWHLRIGTAPDDQSYGFGDSHGDPPGFIGPGGFPPEDFPAGAYFTFQPNERAVMTAQGIVFRGNGANPFGANNCT